MKQKPYVRIATVLFVIHSDIFCATLFSLKNAVFTQKFDKYSLIQLVKEKAIIISFWKERVGKNKNNLV